jgi:hypothetical protein
MSADSVSTRTSRDQVVAAGVALSAFAGSAAHIYSVARDAGNPQIIAALHPAGLDGLIYIGIRGIGRGRKVAGWLATGYGVVASLTFNAVSYAHVPMPAWVMAVAMPVALVLAVLVVGHGTDGPVVEQAHPGPDSGQSPGQTNGQTNGQVSGQVSGQVPGPVFEPDRAELPAAHNGQANGHTLSLLSAPVRTESGQVEGGQAGAGRRRTVPETRPVADRRTDDEILAAHEKTLKAELIAKGQLSRYRVEQVCGIGGRRAKSVRERVYERAGVPLPVDEG